MKHTARYTVIDYGDDVLDIERTIMMTCCSDMVYITGPLTSVLDRTYSTLRRVGDGAASQHRGSLTRLKMTL